MDYRKKFLAQPGKHIKLSKIDPDYCGKHITHKQAEAATDKYRDKINHLQSLLHAGGKHSLLIVLQGMDASGKDGTVHHAMETMNALDTVVTSFKQPTANDLKHDFLWRVHPHAPARGMIAIFNRSHYEDVLVVRVHKLVSRSVWSRRYDDINHFEELLHEQNHTRILKFFLHISKQEQLERFGQRLKDPERNWKISEDDYKEREFWDDYMEAYEDVFAKTSTEAAPWYIIPANHKWFRNLAISQIVADSMEELGMEMPKPQVDLDLIRQQYHEAETEDGVPQHGEKSARHKKK